MPPKNPKSQIMDADQQKDCENKLTIFLKDYLCRNEE